MKAFKKLSVTAYVLAAALVGAQAWADQDKKDDGDADREGDNGKLTLIHTGDFHGHLIPRPNVRSDSAGTMEGGLARVASVIKHIRKDEKHTLYIHTGDTIQGSAEALYTRGQALVDVVNMTPPDAFAPGNWDFVYGTSRFLELFAGNTPQAPWGAVAANLFKDPTGAANGGFCRDRTGEKVLPPYLIKTVGKLKIGILGLTTDRGPQIVGAKVTKYLCFLKNGKDIVDGNGVTTTGGVDSEVAEQVAHLRNVENVDLVVMASEMGLANNIRLAETIRVTDSSGMVINGIDVVLSSDMHEETGQAVVVTNAASLGKTILVEEGQDGTMMGKLQLEIKDKAIKEWEWKAIRVDSRIHEDRAVATKIADIRKTFVTGPDFVQYVNPFNGSKLKRPIDTVVGYTAIPLHRSNFTDEVMPGVIEGSSHDFLTDAFKARAFAQIGAIRGFRYGTHVAPGPIKMEDIYHFMPIGAQIAVGKVAGSAIKKQIEDSADGSLNPDLTKWTGGWLFNFSGVTMNLDPEAAYMTRASSILVNGDKLDTAANYTYASYWYASAPCSINTVPINNCALSVLKEPDGSPLDGTEVVVKYLETLPGHMANPVLNRITLVRPLPGATTANREIQPWRGARP